jgi:hypothetical protein
VSDGISKNGRSDKKMCIAVYVPAGVKPPTKAIFKNCFDTNDDGAGFGWYMPDKEKWQVSKGHMKFSHFWKAFRAQGFDKKPNSVPIVAHFRIGTSGKREHPDCTHPFPICNDYEQMFWHDYETENIAIHNGVLGLGDGDASDTMVYIKKYVNPMLPYLKSSRMGEIMGELIQDRSSRWLITKKDDILMYGDWTEDEGVFYSNDGYEPITVYTAPAGGYRRPPWTGSHHGTGYDWMPKKTDIIQSIYSYVDYTLGKRWSWAKFDRYIQDRDKQLSFIRDSIKGAKTETNPDDGSVMYKSGERDKVWEVYDHDDNVLAVIDKNGDILWDDIEEIPSTIKAFEIKCPNCTDNKNLSDSPFSQGDYLCNRCGAVFCRGQKKILLWDINTRREYDDACKTMEGDI